jgi:hypothetical protein
MKRQALIVESQAEVAQIFNRSLDTIKNWSRMGMPGRRGHYVVGEIFTWLATEGPAKSQRALEDCAVELREQLAARAEPS